MLAIPLDKLIALLDELENNVVGAQLRWRQLRWLIDQEAAQQTVALDGEMPCPACKGEVGHRINCPHGIAFSSPPVI